MVEKKVMVIFWFGLKVKLDVNLCSIWFVVSFSKALMTVLMETAKKGYHVTLNHSPMHIQPNLVHVDICGYWVNGICCLHLNFPIQQGPSFVKLHDFATTSPPGHIRRRRRLVVLDDDIVDRPGHYESRNCHLVDPTNAMPWSDIVGVSQYTGPVWCGSAAGTK